MRSVASGVVVGVLLATAVVGPHGLGAPTHAQPSPEIARATDLYRSAEAAMTEARYDDAIRDYGAAYEVTRDPVLFYKLGTANQRLGKCDLAVIYYKRYLKEGQPGEPFTRTTQDRIVACGGALEVVPDHGGSGSATAPGPGSGSAGSASEPTSQAPVEPVGAAGPADTPEQPVSAAPAPRLGRHRGPWLLIGGSIAFATLGVVLAYSAEAAENDVDDLYLGLNGTPPVFDARTRKRYDDAIDEGQRYQTLSLVSFGIAGATAIGAAVWFVVGSGGGEPARVTRSVRVTPTVLRHGGGVAATLRF